MTTELWVQIACALLIAAPFHSIATELKKARRGEKT